MKKLLVTGVATAVLLGTGAGLDHQAEAKSNIDYLDKRVASKALSGKLVMDGFKIGEKASKYYKSKKYDKKGYRNFWVHNNLDSYHYQNDVAFVDMQNSKKISSSNKKITRIVDKGIHRDRQIYREQMLKIYGKPLKTVSVVRNDSDKKEKRVDMYKNIMFFYDYHQYIDKSLTLQGAVIVHTKNNAERAKWLYYVNSEAGLDVYNMNNYISSTDWASY